MPDNINIKDSAAVTRTLRTTESAGVHTPHHIVESSPALTDAQLRDSPVPVLQDEKTTWRWVVPSTPAGSNKQFLDLFNATGSGLVVRIHSVRCFMDTDTGVTGVLGNEIILVRTSSIGTGGTAWAANAAPQVAGGSLCPSDTASGTINANITGRHLSTAGAANAGWLKSLWVATEETATSQAHLSGLHNIADVPAGCQPIVIREDQGLKLLQGTIAGVGNLAFEIIFSTSTT